MYLIKLSLVSRLDDLEFESKQGKEIFLYHDVKTGSGAHLVSCSRGTRVLFFWGGGGLWINCLGRDVDYSP